MHSVLPRPLKGLQIPGPRSVGVFLVRYLASVAFATWFGGFTFYAAVVVPDLHEALGGLETGEISRRVSLILNAIGGAAVTLGWLRVASDRGARAGRRGLARLVLLGVTSVLLLILIAFHRHLGMRLDSGESLSTFRPVHEYYLILSTVQWSANLGLLAIEAATSRPGADQSFEA